MRLEGWKNPYTISVLREKTKPDGTTTSTDGYTRKKIPDPIFEAGADALWDALWQMAKDSPTKMFTIDARPVRVFNGTMTNVKIDPLPEE